MEYYFSYSKHDISFHNEEIFDKVFSLENFTLASTKANINKLANIISCERYEFDNDDALVKEYLQKYPYKYDKIYHCSNRLWTPIPLAYISIKEHDNSEGYIFLSFIFDFIYSEKSHKHFDCIKDFNLFKTKLVCEYVSKYDFDENKKKKFIINFYSDTVFNSKILNKLKELFETKKKTDINSYINKKYMDAIFKEGESKVKRHLYYIYNDDVMELIRKDDFAELERIKKDYYGKIPEFKNITCEAFIDTQENNLIINVDFECQNDKYLLQRRGFINWNYENIISCSDIYSGHSKSKYPSCAVFLFDKNKQKYYMGSYLMDENKYPLSRQRIFYELQKTLGDKLEFKTYFNTINNSNLDLDKKCVYSLKTLEQINNFAKMQI